MANTFNGTALWTRMARRIESGVNATAEEAESIAVDKAPVRKVQKASTGSKSLQSNVEAAAEKQVRQNVGLGPGPVQTQRKPASAKHSIMSVRQLTKSGALKVNIPLTVRGRFELKSGRANFTSAAGTTLGGRLRGEIHVEPAEGGGSRWTAKVVSPTAYAKYVEFGTRHSRAQPYMRPALAQVRSSFRKRMSAAVRPGRAA